MVARSAAANPRPQAHGLVAVTLAHFPALVQSVQRPGQPTAVALEKCYAELWKTFEYAAGAKAADRKHQLDRIAKRVDQHGFIAVTLEAMHGLILVGACRRMEADRRGQFFRFAPKRVVVPVMDVASVDRLRH